MPRTRVLLADDHTVVAEGLKSLLEDTFDLVGVVHDGRALLEAVEILRPDVVVTDISMPLLNGLDAIPQIRARHPDTKIVVLTMHNDDDTLLEALDAGASALILKSSSADDVLDAIRRAASAPDAFTATGLGAALLRRDTVTAAKPMLTPRETEVLMRLVDGDSVALVARQLFMSESTVKTHVARVYEKLGAHNRASAIMAAVRLGFVKADAH